MKKLIAMMLILALAVGFAACGSKTEEPTVEEAPAVEDVPMVTPDDELPDDVPLVTPDDELPDEAVEIEYMPEEKLAELSGIMDQLIAGINDEMMVGTMEITADMYAYYGIPATEGIYAVVSMPMIGSIAHEVVLVELADDADALTFCSEMEAAKDPMKWVCVEPEESWTKASGKYVVSVMTTKAMSEGVSANMDAVFAG